MRRKPQARRVVHGREGEDEGEEDDGEPRQQGVCVRRLHGKVFRHGLHKRRKQMCPASEGADGHPSGGQHKHNMVYEVGSPTGENFTDSDSNPEESDYLQSRTKAELIAMVLCMQREMESLKEQIQCLTACGKLARNLEALIERTQVWTGGDCKHQAPNMPNAGVERDTMMPTLLNGPWVKQDASPRDCQPNSNEDSMKNGLYSEVITPQLLEQCNTGTTAQKLTNDLLRGLYERECLASHSISAIVYNKRGQPKPALPADEVHAILRTVQHFFPGKTDAEIKGYIRQKLQNEAKRLRKKPLLPVSHGDACDVMDIYT